MIEKPEVDLSYANSNTDQMINLCENALLNKGKDLNKLKEYQEAIHSMKEEIKKSKANIHTIAILSNYCKILE